MFVRDEIHCNVYMISTYFEDFRASVTPERRKGLCVQKAAWPAFAKIRNRRVLEHPVKQTGKTSCQASGFPF
ncbi:MAG TPA: hypothetical protein DCZ04_09390 [Syntrophorhabdus aromaticivorans]|nr:hypothetical protein [Syntrophorhabdus aromaticivorans]